MAATDIAEMGETLTELQCQVGGEIYLRIVRFLGIIRQDGLTRANLVPVDNKIRSPRWAKRLVFALTRQRVKIANELMDPGVEEGFHYAKLTVPCTSTDKIQSHRHI